MLTEKDKEVLEIIKNYMLEKGVTPTIREIGEKMYRNPKAIHFHFKKLEDEGYLERIDNSPRYRVKGMEYREADG